MTSFGLVCLSTPGHAQTYKDLLRAPLSAVYVLQD